jgi:hypothetical protein
METLLAENQFARDLIGCKNFFMIKYINLSVTFIFIIIVSYIPAIVLIFLRKRSQPIRHRSPYLLLISLLSIIYI